MIVYEERCEAFGLDPEAVERLARQRTGLPANRSLLPTQEEGKAS